MNKKRHTQLIVALDTPDKREAQEWCALLDPYVGCIKFGLEFVCANGFQFLPNVAGDLPYFLDMKFHDIPNTVAAAIRSLRRYRPSMLTLHITGGAEMLRAARRACDETFPPGQRPLLLGVTVLTSLQDNDLKEIGFAYDASDLVKKMGYIAIKNGLDGLVCSGHDIYALRQELGQKPILVTPGIRPQGFSRGDQKRIMTPGEASAAGADWIVVGRPITQSSNPSQVAGKIAYELQHH